MKNTRVVILMGLLIALEIVLTRFLGIQPTPTLRIGFGFIAISLSAIMFGPILGGITAVVADILGMVLFPKGAYFPGFTLSAFLGGAIYGLYLYKKPKSILRITLAVLTIIVFVDLGLNTLWLSMITGKAALAIITPRIVKSVIMLPIQTVIIYVLWKYIGAYVDSRFVSKQQSCESN
jgi:ECF transporter S component (folate family)